MSKSFPLLLLDVDGVISLFGFEQGAPPNDYPISVDGIPHWLSKPVAERIQRVQEHFECVWCTGWEDRANDHLPHHLGLGPFPYLRLASAGAKRHWKLDAIDAYAGANRPLAWVDDALTEECESWASSRPGPTLLVHTDPAVGLTEADAAALAAFSRRVRRTPLAP